MKSTGLPGTSRQLLARVKGIRDSFECAIGNGLLSENTCSLKRWCQQTDEATMLEVVLGGGELRESRG